MKNIIIALLLFGFLDVTVAQDTFTIAQEITGNSRTDTRGQAFTPNIQGTGTGSITASDFVYLESFDVIFDSGTEPDVLYIYSELPSDISTLDDGTGGTLVGQSTSKQEGDFPFTSYRFDNLELSLTEKYFAVFRSDVDLEFGGSTDEAGPYAGGKMLVNDGGVVAENNFTALKFISTLNNQKPPNSGDLDALLALYHATDGSNWNVTWDLDGDPYEWEGVIWDDDRVSAIYLRSNALSGSIPTEIGELTTLINLELTNNNSLSGSIPSSIGNLTELTSLNLSGNSLTGEIPSEIGNLVNLQYLILGTSSSGNQLSGEIPSSIWGLTGLLELELERNQLSGEIPESIGALSSLTRLSLGYNNFTNTTIPVSILALMNLNTLKLSNLAFQGEVPTEIQNLNQLNHLDLSYNEFSGSLNFISQFSELSSLYLHGNNFSGSIPTSIVDLDLLTNLNISDNQLSGTIPTDIGNLENLRELNINTNQLTGTIPTSVGSLTTLVWFSLSFNELSGELPDELYQITTLEYIYLDHNLLEGQISESIQNLQNLRILSISNNNFEGDLPDELANLEFLRSLILGDNSFTSLPTMPQPDLSLVVDNNLLDFGSLEPNAHLFSNFTSYRDQGPIPVPDTFNINLGEPFTLSIGERGENTAYRWFKDDVFLSESVTYEIESFSQADIGSYYCEMTNVNVPVLMITTVDIAVNVSFDFASENQINNAGSGIELTSSLTQVGDVYYIIEQDQQAPSALQVRDGKNATGEDAFAAGSFTIATPFTDINHTIASLSPASSYYIYLTAQSRENNELLEEVLELTFEIVLDADHRTEHLVNVYPNPATDFLRVDVPKQGALTISIFDQTGRLVRYFNLFGSGQLDVRELPNGIYQMLMTGENSSQTTHLIKK